ncbi:MAG: copper chaperone PCu(A)C [Gammaproteobacteria bacterium]|nr:copper chaperone PCu(A)C [Gammaproteobacteria bacterium]
MKQYIVICLLLLSACSKEILPPLVASDLEVTRPVPGMQMSAGYVTLRNNTDEIISVSHVVSGEFARVEIHESTVEDGVARMRRLPELLVPANDGVSLKPGGKHLMLMRPADNLDVVSLSFFSGDTLLLSVEVQLASERQ